MIVPNAPFNIEKFFSIINRLLTKTENAMCYVSLFSTAEICARITSTVRFRTPIFLCVDVFLLFEGDIWWIRACAQL
jgi:hypothetical protein